MARFGLTRALHPPSSANTAGPVTTLETELTVAFTDCQHANARAERALQLLLTHSGSRAGCLFLMAEEGPRLAASVGDNGTPDLTIVITDFIQREREERGMVTASLIEDTEVLLQRSAGPMLILLSHQTTTGLSITGAAALICDEAFVHPGALPTRLSRMLEQFGDTFTLMLS